MILQCLHAHMLMMDDQDAESEFMDNGSLPGPCCFIDKLMGFMTLSEQRPLLTHVLSVPARQSVDLQ